MNQFNCFHGGGELIFYVIVLFLFALVLYFRRGKECPSQLFCLTNTTLAAWVQNHLCEMLLHASCKVSAFLSLLCSNELKSCFSSLDSECHGFAFFTFASQIHVTVVDFCVYLVTVHWMNGLMSNWIVGTENHCQGILCQYSKINKAVGYRMNCWEENRISQVRRKAFANIQTLDLSFDWHYRDKEVEMSSYIFQDMIWWTYILKEKLTQRSLGSCKPRSVETSWLSW